MKIGKYVTNYLSADDVEDPRIGTITKVAEERVGGKDGDDKLVAYFEEFDGGIVLNKTNLLNLASIFGSEETNDWPGEKVTVWRDPSVQFGGKKVGGIAFRKYDPKISTRLGSADSANA